MIRQRLFGTATAIVAIATAILLTSPPLAADGAKLESCTVIGVGRLATVDGSVITSHTDCCSECRIQVIPGRTYPRGVDGPCPLGHGLLRRRGRPPRPAPRRVRQGHRRDPPGRAHVHLFPYRLFADERAAAGHRREHLLPTGRARRRLHRGPDAPDHDHRAGPGLRPGALRDGPRGREAHRRPRREVRIPPFLRRVRVPVRRRSARALDDGDLQRRRGVDPGGRQARRHLGGAPRPRRPCRRHRQLFPHPRGRPEEPRRPGLAELHEGGRRPRLVRSEERPALHLAGDIRAARHGREPEPDVARHEHARAVAQALAQARA